MSFQNTRGLGKLGQRGQVVTPIQPKQGGGQQCGCGCQGREDAKKYFGQLNGQRGGNTLAVA